jgi:hypothetical protein
MTLFKNSKSLKIPSTNYINGDIRYYLSILTSQQAENWKKIFLYDVSHYSAKRISTIVVIDKAVSSRSGKNIALYSR